MNIGEIAREMTVKEICDQMRKDAKRLEDMARTLMTHSVFSSEQAYPNQHSEMKAQTMLAVRHLEDARMRVGKILQYADDGVSILDK